jgi:hypothetical protein
MKWLENDVSMINVLCTHLHYNILQHLFDFALWKQERGTKRRKTKWKDEMSVKCKVQGSSMMEMVVSQKNK